jgi:pimeloyl-ACP methyl ester carboxylesterase
MTLPDGRILAYVQWGRPAGPVVVLCHPATRIVQPGWDVAEALGIRVVSPDRPGTGGSAFQPGRSILDWPADIAALMDHLGVERFSVVGVSACTPYALACGVQLGNSVDMVGVVAGTVPREDVSDPLGALGQPDREAALAELLRQSESVAADIAASVRRVGERPDPDGPLYRRPEVQAALLAATRETYRQGTQGPAYDSLLRILPWGFALGDLARPCLWWHGAADPVVSPELVERAIAGHPQYHLHLVAGAGHGICMTHVDQLLRRLLFRDTAE